MKKPKPHDTHRIVAVARVGLPIRSAVLYGTEEECKARMAHIRKQAVREWNYRIEPLPEENEENRHDTAHSASPE